MKIRILTTALFIGVFVVVSPAQSATPSLTGRQATQKTRIAEGKASGELTKRETRQLVRQQRRVARHKSAVKSDGTVTAKERAGVHIHQNKADRNIRRKKHNGRD